MRLVFATNNQHKLQELRQIIGDSFEIVGLKDIGCHEEIPETGVTLAENALQKVRYIHDRYGVDCFADDTGLEVDALGGAPGVYSARYAAMHYGKEHCTPEENVALMLSEMQTATDRKACFRTCIALILNGKEYTFDGRVDGEITTERHGDGGFGYDPIFRPEGWDKTFAEASADEKNAISHRGRASKKLQQFLSNLPKGDSNGIMKGLATLIVFLSAFVGAFAQGESWFRFPIFADSISSMAEASDKVYFLSGQNLFSYSADSEENYSYSSINKLTDSAIKDTYYNYDGKYLLIVYENSNIDVLFDDGKVINLPEIRDAQFADKTINDVGFGDDIIAIATAFGIVIYDEAKMEVRESGVYNVDIWNIAVLEGHIVIFYRDPVTRNYDLCQAPIAMRHNTIDKFQRFAGNYMGSITPIGGNKVVITDRGTGELSVRAIDFAGNTWSTLSKPQICIKSRPQRYDDGFYAYDDNQLVLFDEQGGMTTKALPEQLRGQKLALRRTPDKVWAGDSEGIALYDISGPTPVVKYDKLLPVDFITVTPVGYLRWSADKQRLYVSNITCSHYKSSAKDEFTGAYQTTNIIENGYPREASLMTASATHDKSKRWQQAHGNRRMYGDPMMIIEDPDNKDIYYCANYHEGVYVLKYNPTTAEYEEIGKFDASNSPMVDDWGSRAQDVNIDPEGNLWVGFLKGSRYAILPAAKRKADPATVKKSDWKEMTRLREIDIDQKDMMSLICRKSNIVFVFSGKAAGGLVAIDTKGTYADLSDDAIMHWLQFTDQDGNVFETPTNITFAIEDRRGCVWIGTSAGIFEITNPETAATPTMTVRRIKVPRNDGTPYADYLLESEKIAWISEDPSGRKWVATLSSGIFLISETGDAILRNYHVGNSPLPSNEVLSVEADPNSNTVYVGTPYGLYTLLSNSSPAKEDFSEVYAYPNPVRPEYTGDVTIAGLMDDSIVKIADAAGNVIFQTRSEGGMASWNVCNASGQRVRSGVYFIFVTSSASSSTKGAVAKIAVIN